MAKKAKPAEPVAHPVAIDAKHDLHNAAERTPRQQAIYEAWCKGYGISPS
ncbi:hypothetical protein [Mesorhizobium sp.]|nr:hypothetical protein [Mesorhizobium sp.]